MCRKIVQPLGCYHRITNQNSYTCLLGVVVSCNSSFERWKLYKQNMSTNDVYTNVLEFALETLSKNEQNGRAESIHGNVNS